MHMHIIYVLLCKIGYSKYYFISAYLYMQLHTLISIIYIKFIYVTS